MHDGRPRRHDIFPPSRGAEALGQDQAIGGEHHARRRERLAVHVVERQRVEDAIAAVLDDDEAAHVAVPGAGVQVVEVRQDAALRASRRARRVEQAALRVEARLTALRRHARHRQRRRPCLGIDHGQRVLALARDGLEVGHAGGDDDGDVCVRVLHLVEHFVVPVLRIDRHDAAAQRVERQVVKEELRAVLQQQGHAVAVAVAGRGVRDTQPFDLGGRLRVRVLDADRMVGAVGCRRGAEKGVIGRCRGRPGEDVVDGLHRRADSSAKRREPRES